MKTPLQHIEHIKGKPHHIRKRVAFVIAGSVSGLIALVWLVSNITLGAFALTGGSFADSTGAASVITTTEPDTSGLAGVAASQEEKTPAHIEIVDTTPVKAPSKPTDQTIIPF